MSHLGDKTFEKLQNAFNGKRAVTYDKDFCLTFAVPIKFNDQDCLMYNTIPDESVRETFHAVSYNGVGTIILLNSMDNWMILSEGEQLINLDPEMQPGWNKLGKNWNQEGGKEKGYTSVYYQFKGDSYGKIKSNCNRWSNCIRKEQVSS